MYLNRNGLAYVVIALLSFIQFAGCKPPSPPAPNPVPQPNQPVVAPDAPPAIGPEPAPADSSSTNPSTSTLSPVVPFDVTAGPPFTLDSLQHDFDVMSWNTFVALNWPADANGEPDKSKTIGETRDNSTVWESWKASYEIFLPNGAPPTPWGTPRTPPADWPQHCKDLFPKDSKILIQVGKAPNVVEESVQPFKTGPLIDVNGKYARFEILASKSMFDYIVAHKLYSKAGQQDVTKVVFPCGTQKKVDDKNVVVEMGAIMVKAAWKLLSDDEQRSGLFHKTQAVVYTPPSAEPKVEEKCELMWVGLVGLHIVHKTPGSPQWVWSTFEHVNNCPTDGEPADKPQYNFFSKGPAAPPKNEPPPRPWDPNNTEPPDRHTQIVRMAPLADDVKMLNAEFQAALRKVNKDSVWQYYELVSTQWPTNPSKDCDVEAGAPVDRIGTPAPQFLANTTLESYIQGKVPNVSSSCMECHANATTTTAVFSDFTFLLQRAQ